MYLKHFRLNEKPFEITANPKFLWLGDKHKEALSVLRYGIMENKGFLLMTGEVGVGKTVLVQQLVEMLEINTSVATVPDPGLSPIDFFRFVADGFGINRDFNSKGEFLLHLRDILRSEDHGPKQLLLIIDEAQRLGSELLEDIRLLSNLEPDGRRPINIFFVGQAEIHGVLGQVRNRAVAQRIALRYSIEPLDQNETIEFIQHRLKVAGMTKPIFKPDALQEVYNFSGGIPRLVNIICDNALLTAYVGKKKQVDGQTVLECAEELRPPEDPALPDSVWMPKPKKQPTSQEDAKPPAEKVADASQTPAKASPGAPLPASDSPKLEEKKGPWLLFGYILLTLALLALGVTAYLTFQPPEGPRWSTHELTSQRFQEQLAAEKKVLSQQMAEQSMAPDSQATSATASAEKAEKRASDVPSDQKALAVLEKTPQTKLPAEKIASSAVSVRTETKPDIAPKGVFAVTNDDFDASERFVLHFQSNNNDLKEDAFPVLDQIANYLLQHPGATLTLRGYTDNKGHTAYNRSVSGFRARVVKSYLVGKGVPTQRIQTFGLGEADPIADNTTLEGRRKNRRVEIEIGQPPAGGLPGTTQ